MLTKRQARAVINEAKHFKLTRGLTLYDLCEGETKGIIRYKGHVVTYDLTPKGAVARIATIYEVGA